MRYFRLKETRCGFQQFIWIEFEGRRPWLDMNDPTVVMTLMFVGAGVHDIDLVGVDRAGNRLPLTELGGAEVPATRNGFPNRDPDQRRLTRLSVQFPAAGALQIMDGRTNRRILQISPEIVYPEFLFDLLQEMRASFAPGTAISFIETGTLFGHTTLHASYWFDQVKTIELSRDLCQLARTTLSHRPNVEVLQGNSAEVLPQVIAGLQGPAVFFLDAHWSGDKTVDWTQSRWGGYPVETAHLSAGTGPEAPDQVPLREELQMIAGTHKGPAMVIIDDWGSVGSRDVGFAGEDWSTLDAQALIAWMGNHPRTQSQYQPDPKHYVWILSEQ